MSWRGRLLCPGMETLISHCSPGERQHSKQAHLLPLTFDCRHLKHLVGFPKSVPMKLAFSHYLGALITKPNHQIQPVSTSVWQKPWVKRSVSWKVIQGSCHGICSLPDLLTGSHIDSQVPWASPPRWLFIALFSPDSFSLGRTAQLSVYPYWILLKQVNKPIKYRPNCI